MLNNFYIYNFKKVTKDNDRKIITTIFFYGFEISSSNLQSELNLFFESNQICDEFLILFPDYISNKTIIDNDFYNEIFFKIPHKQIILDNNSFSLYYYNRNFEFTSSSIHNYLQKDDIKDEIINYGLQNIFIKRGGLVETEGGHHYVFPSGKHCGKFLRTGNILLYSSEIYFIASVLLKYIQENITTIFCDTSSINSLAVALNDLINRFRDKSISLSIQSFNSYDGLYKKTSENFNNNSLILISSSTSGNILNYITKSHKNLKKENILILFFLDLEDTINNIKENVLCDLTYDFKKNSDGIMKFESFKKNEKCKLCDSGSYAVEITGDVFLLEKPKVNSILIKRTDAPNFLNKFILQFKSNSIEKNNVLKSHYKELTDDYKYETFIDFEEILDHKENYDDYIKKLNSYIDQFVPANLVGIIHLDDNGSKELSNHIYNKIKGSLKDESQIKIQSKDDDLKFLKDKEGAVLIVASCISNGKNLLYLSRALRNYDNIRVVYFTGVSRLNNKENFNYLKQNLMQGSYGRESSSFVSVENIYISNMSKETTWINETDFLKDIINFLTNDSSKYSEAIKFFKERENILLNSVTSKGLSNNLFYCNLDGKNLRLRKNFAFWNFSDYVDDVSQADVFFTISCVINNLRNNVLDDRVLKQSTFVRNLISPANFNRYNDGIIQACILRSSTKEELSYSIDSKISSEMKEFLITLVSHSDNEQGEAIYEFLYSISVNNLTLKKSDLEIFIKITREKMLKDEIAMSFCDYIDENNFESIAEIQKKEPIKKTFRSCKKKLKGLKKKLKGI